MGGALDGCVAVAAIDPQHPAVEIVPERDRLRRRRALDHLVLCVHDVAATCRFYARVLGLEARASPTIAQNTVPGSGNFCVLTDTPIDTVVAHLRREGIEIVAGPGERTGATGPLLSVYFKDPDGNLVEVSNQL
jgi:catechol 2,3-dioxygenase-like lactoylglutathione lyase family enzyme